MNVLQTRSPIIPKYFSVFQNKDTLLNNYVTDIQMGKLTLVYFCHLIHRSHSNFAICLNRVLCRERGSSLAVQWLRLLASTAGGSLVRELRPCIVPGAAKKKNRINSRIFVLYFSYNISFDLDQFHSLSLTP